MDTAEVGVLDGRHRPRPGGVTRRLRACLQLRVLVLFLANLRFHLVEIVLQRRLLLAQPLDEIACRVAVLLRAVQLRLQLRHPPSQLRQFRLRVGDLRVHLVDLVRPAASVVQQPVFLALLLVAPFPEILQPVFLVGQLRLQFVVGGVGVLDLGFHLRELRPFGRQCRLEVRLLDLHLPDLPVEFVDLLVLPVDLDERLPTLRLGVVPALALGLDLPL